MNNLNDEAQTLHNLVKPEDNKIYFPLSTQQKGMWNIELVFPNTTIGVISATVSFDDRIDFLLFEKAINICIEKNDSYRLRVTLDGKSHVQYLHDYSFKAIKNNSFESIDELRKYETELISSPFNLTDSDLYLFEMFRVKDSFCGLFIKLHHLISDAWTQVLTLNKITYYYSLLKSNDKIPCEKDPSFIAYLSKENEYLESKSFLNNREFWNSKFISYPEFNILKPYSGKDSIKANRKTFILNKDLADKMHIFIKNYNVTPFTLFMSALTIYINKISSKDDIVLGSPILTRSNFKDKATSGMFINVIPMRFCVDTNCDFISFANYVSKEIRQYLKNGKYPYDYLLKDFKKVHKTDKIYDVLLSYQNSTIDKTYLPNGYFGEWHFNGYQTESLCIHIDDRDNKGEYYLNFDYLTDAFDENEIVKIYEYLVNIIDCAITKPKLQISQIEIVSASEKDIILNVFNSNKLEYPKESLFHLIFEEHVEKYPDHIAVICEDKTLTYAELNSKANQFAHLLRSKGVTAETIVGIMLGRSVEVVVGVLAILKAGGAYLPIDPSYPMERIQYILKDCDSNILIIDNSVSVENLCFELLNIEDTALYNGNNLNLNTIIVPSNLMYVIYTSGSTGKPKGVMIEHRHFMNIAFSWRKEYMLHTFDVSLLQLASFSFDVFSGDLARTFLNGGTLIITSEEEKYSFPKLHQLINTHSVNIFESTPAFILPFMEYIHNNNLNIDSIKLLILGSDTCLNQDFRKLNERFGSKMRIINSYGVTEATIDSSYYEANLNAILEAGSTPIGKPLGNVRFYVLDDNLQIKPIGAIGELYISGNSISRGYYNNLELTKQRFLPNPFVPGEIIYKTGDIVKWLPDGNLVFSGRVDTQVKIKGFRIELGEIENKILAMPFIKEAVVLVKNAFLYSFFISDIVISSEDIKAHLQKALPNYMIPNCIKQLEALPLSPNGKIDRNVLLLNYCTNENTNEYVPPSNQIEKELSAIWSEALEIDKIGVTDNFFDLGGDSLAIISILSLSYKFNWNLSIQSFYQYQTIRELTAFIQQLAVNNEVVPANNINELGNYSCIASVHKDIENIGDNYYTQANILLTGSTGFLGIHILHDLLIETKSNIYCLIRGNDNNRLDRLIQFYFGNEASHLLYKRVFIVNGDVSEENFGLSECDYNDLSNTIDSVIHSAALVKHYGNVSDFNKVNVLGTAEVIRFCYNNIKKRLLHISTTSVSGDSLKQESQFEYSENDFYIGQNYKDSIYIRSKFESENLVLHAFNEDLDGAVFRVGNLTGRYSDGLFQKNIGDNMFYNNIKSIITLGKIPSNLLNFELELTPVDQCSKAILKILQTKESNKKVFHLCNNNFISIRTLLDLLNKLNFPVLAINAEHFLEFINERDSLSKTSSLFLINDYNFVKIADKNYKVKINSRITNDYLKKLNFNWSRIDINYISRLLEHAESVGFIDDLSNRDCVEIV